MKKHDIKVSYSGYKCAPESFSFYVNGKVYAERYSQLASDLGYLIICGKENEAIDRIKRDIRANYKKPHYITYGFYKVDQKKDYFFTRQLYANDNDLADKLRIYKEFKHYIESQNCILNTYEVAAGDFIPGEKSAAKKQVIQEKADLTRPVKIHLVA